MTHMDGSRAAFRNFTYKEEYAIRPCDHVQPGRSSDVAPRRETWYTVSDPCQFYGCISKGVGDGDIRLDAQIVRRQLVSIIGEEAAPFPGECHVWRKLVH